MHQYHIEILKIYTSPGHNYFGNKQVTPRGFETISHTEARLVTAKGIEGDRFFNIRPDHHAQVTFFAYEVFEALQKITGIEENLALFRRNIVCRGVDLRALIGHEFTIGDVTFSGSGHCAPCKWMNRMVHADALKLMKGRGGLRARVVSGGILKTGGQLMTTMARFSPGEADQPIQRLRLP